jgi:DNA (cytosine-5)-methyltransferase 1
MYEGLFGTADYYQVEDIWNTRKIISEIPAERAALATASFPCVDLSLAGNLRGFDGEQSGTFYGFLKVLRALKSLNRLPKALLIENVLGFLSSHQGKFFRIALRSLSKLGYHLDAFVVDAKHFVPQSRPRLFIVGFLRELLPSARILSTTDSFRLSAKEFDPVRPATLLDALKKSLPNDGWVPLRMPMLPGEKRNLHQFIDTDPAQNWWGEELVEKHLAEMHAGHLDRIERLRTSESVTVGTIYRRVREGRSRSEIRTDGVAGCLRTPRGGSSKQIVFVAGGGTVRMRWMSPLEYARLQGCPNFPIQVDRNEALFGFGDAVCVPVIGWIARNVLSQLFPNTAVPRKFQQAAGD